MIFLGWFGPRGLATVVFALVAAEELGGVMDPLVTEVVAATVLLSILVHGVTAVPMSRWLAGMPMRDDMSEMGAAYAHPTRR